MNPVALYFASGESLYPGVALLLLVMVVSLFLDPARLLRLRNVGVWLAVSMIVMACPPFAFSVDLILVAAFALWFIASNRTGSSHTWMRLRRGSTVFLMTLLLLLMIVEVPHRTMPVVAGKPSDHLVVIGDSISSGIDSRVPAWPDVLQQTSGLSVRNLARPGAQVSDGLTDAQRAELDYRIARHEQNPSDVIPWQQVRAGLFKKP
jgi:putative addiction module component (TIGR02574 family)